MLFFWALYTGCTSFSTVATLRHKCHSYFVLDDPTLQFLTRSQTLGDNLDDHQHKREDTQDQDHSG